MKFEVQKVDSKGRWRTVLILSAESRAAAIKKVFPAGRPSDSRLVETK